MQVIKKPPVEGGFFIYAELIGRICLGFQQRDVCSLDNHAEYKVDTLPYKYGMAYASIETGNSIYFGDI